MTTLFVCENQFRAMRAKQELMLGDEFKAVGFGAGLGGAGFDKVLVVLPPRVLREHELDWCRNYLPLKLFPGGKVKYLN